MQEMGIDCPGVSGGAARGPLDTGPDQAATRLGRVHRVPDLLGRHPTRQRRPGMDCAGSFGCGHAFGIVAP